MDTKQIGNLTELQCITALYELGCSVSIPFGDSEKYDLIIDYKNKLYKVQCKYSHEIVDEGKVTSIRIETTWFSHGLKKCTRNKYQLEEIDYFATYYNNKCYLIPSNQCSNAKILRIEAPKNKQLKGINFLNDYEASKILEAL